MTVTITRNPNLTKARAEVHFDHEVKRAFGHSWWTGLSPEECPGFDKKRQCLRALPLLNLDICTREDVLDYFNNSWTLTELLFQSLKTESAYKRPPYHGLRHPLIFYYGHPAVLYFNKLRVAQVFKDPINLYLEKVLETGVDEMSWDDMSKNEMEWPGVAEVHAFRKTVYDHVVTLIKTHPDLDQIGKANKLEGSIWWALWMGMEHEKIHLETSSVLIRELPIEYVEAPKFWVPLHPSANESLSAPENHWKTHKGGDVILGKSNDFPSYGWDNEYGSRKTRIADFQYTEFQISNAEFFEFVKSGSYIVDKYWSPEGLEWRKFRNTKRPTFWVATGPEGAHEYELRTLFNIIPMPWSWPVEVNFHEAEAYCRWRNEKEKVNLKYRLLTEAEFVSLIKQSGPDPVLQTRHYREGSSEDHAFNFNLLWSGPVPVNPQMLGNTWHWLIDQFNPLDEFHVHPYYDDFSTPCFDGKHQMILGGSFISCGDEASHWARFHFRPHFYQHSGFRMAATLDGSADNASVRLLESDTYVHPRRENVLDQMHRENWWKNVDQPLEMNSTELELLFKETQQEVLSFIKKYPELSPMGSAHDPASNALKSGFKVPYQMTKNFPEGPTHYDQLLKLIFNELAPLSQLPGHPGFAAYMAGSDNAISNAAQFIAQTLNPYTAHFMMAPGLVTLEQEVIKWFINMTGMSETASGYLTSGSSTATLNALMYARQKNIHGHDFTPVTGYMSDQAHHSLAKAWALLGFKKENLRIIKSHQLKMDTEALKLKIAEDKKAGLIPFFLCATIGSTNSGSVDDISAMADIAKRESLWLHGDGAYGGFFMLTQKGKSLLKGIEQCDSLALDPHKSLSLPYGTGCLLVKDVKTLITEKSADSSYMPPQNTDGDYDYADITPELSRDFRGLRVWLPIKTLGIAPFALNLEEKLKLATYLEGEIKKISDLVLSSAPELSILTFRHKKGENATRLLLEKINQSGTLFLSATKIHDDFVIRICLLGHRMHYGRVEKFVSELKTLAEQC